MKNETRTSLLKAAHKYYPVGHPFIEGWSQDIRRIIGDKVDGKADALLQWKGLVESSRSENNLIEIIDLSFLQFPNLMLIFEDVEKFTPISVHKNLVLCLSLLCPFYTYYHEYTHKVSTNGGLITLNKLVFLSDETLANLKGRISEMDIAKNVKKFFPDYSYIYHYDLMMNKIVGGFPHGIDGMTEGNLEYSIYQFLFNNEQSDSIFS